MSDQVDRNRIVTPYTDPDRWTEDEQALFDEGRCSWTVEFGNWGPVVHCGEPSEPGVSFGHCAEHNDQMLETCYPDGSPRDL